MDKLSDDMDSAIRRFGSQIKLRFRERLMTASKIKKQDDCWCHSGEIYENCHLNKSMGRILSAGEIRDEISKIFRNKKFCCASFDTDNCKLPIKGAHTIQRARVLDSLSKEGHVGTFYQNHNGYEAQKDFRSGIKKEASIFYGFCDFHDTNLFREIEVEEFEISSENCWASSYRAVCHEFYQKNAAKEAVLWQQQYIDQGRSLEHQIIIQEDIFFQKRDILKGFGDIEKVKEKYEKIKIKENFSQLSSYVIELDESLEIAVSACISPYYDIDGKKIQNLGDPHVDFQYIAISTIIVNDNAAYVLSYLKEHSVMGEYLSV